MYLPVKKRYKIQVKMELSRQNAVKLLIEMSLKVIRQYEWLLDLYVLDFFVDNHWDKLPVSWRECFENIDPKDLGDIICGEPSKSNLVLPLSFLALIKTVKTLTISRKQSNINHIKREEIGEKCGDHPRLKNLFLKHVKLKKRHEIGLMAGVVADTAEICECKAVVDFGSGLGHLVRMLAYKYDIYSAGIEGQHRLTEEARKLDEELEYTAKKHLTQHAISNLHRPLHFNVTLYSEDQLEQLSLPETMKNYGLIGLHPCGDLGPLLLRSFVNNTNIKFICLVGCCYMKLSCGKADCGYPMSKFVQGLNSKLSFVSREIACHAIEVYCDRLRKGNYEDLKIHAFRAALEKILIEQDPKLRHAPVRSIKHSKTMTFYDYCSLATQRLGVRVPRVAPAPAPAQWRRVVVLYSLRLAVAPLVESVVLLDRALYVLEHGLNCEIRPVFDPCISPRNQVIIAKR